MDFKLRIGFKVRKDPKKYLPQKSHSEASSFIIQRVMADLLISVFYNTDFRWRIFKVFLLNNFENTLEFGAKMSKGALYYTCNLMKNTAKFEGKLTFWCLMCKNTMDYRGKNQTCSQFYRCFEEKLNPTIWSSNCAHNIEHFFDFFAR